METFGIRPEDVIRPTSNYEAVVSFFRRGRVTNDLITRLSGLDATIIVEKGSTKREVTMDDVKSYIEKEAEFRRIHYPSGYRYNAQVEKGRKRALMMERMLQKNNYRALIKPMLDSAVKHWNIADRQDARVREMSVEEKEQAERIYSENLRRESEIIEREGRTGKKEEHGIPPQLLEVGGDRNRQESRVFLAYAVVLAKKVKE